MSGPIDQKELEAKLKALESRFRPYFPELIRDDITTKWIRYARQREPKPIRSNKPVRARPKPNHSGTIKPLVKMAKGLPPLPTKRVTWTRAKCIKEAQNLIGRGFPRQGFGISGQEVFVSQAREKQGWTRMTPCRLVQSRRQQSS